MFLAQAVGKEGGGGLTWCVVPSSVPPPQAAESVGVNEGPQVLELSFLATESEWIDLEGQPCD